MHIVLVGADLEENLGVGMIAASLEAAGHRVEVVAFDATEALPRVADWVLAARPGMVGLSAQFQHRAADFLRLARTLRARGFEGHLTMGGQFPTMAFHEVLQRGTGVDSVVLHEGEQTVVELCAALEANTPLAAVAGLALPERGLPRRTAGRALADLDALPWPKRYRSHDQHFGIPFVPIMGGRGCWGACSYCSITTFYRDARAHGGGRTVRLRSPDDVAGEMACLAEAAGGRAIFCFHDDNFLLPRPKDTLARVRAIRARLDEYGAPDVAIIGKCRPDCVTGELLVELAALGVIRLYIGVENASQHGADDLNRRTQTARVRAALAAAREADIFVCYNLLLFEPEATLADVRENLAFMREHAEHPVNFCRAEPYHGTPLHRGLEARAALSGSHLGWDYRIADDRTELLFRICAAAFRERNYAPEGVANRTMSLGYAAKVLQRFYPGSRATSLARRATELTRRIVLDTADLLERATDLATQVDLADHDRIERETARLGLEIAALDRVWHRAIDDLHGEMRACTRSATPPPRRPPARKLVALAKHAALASALALWSTGTAGCGGEVVDPVPADTGVKKDSMVADPVPTDTGVDSMVADPLPEDTGMDFGPVDPPPIDSGVDATVDATDGASDAADTTVGRIDRFRDTAPQRSERTADLPLHRPLGASLRATREGELVHVQIVGAPAAIGTRWEAEGAVVGDGASVTWTPASPSDRLAVAIRAQGGVAVLAVRVREV